MNEAVADPDPVGRIAPFGEWEEEKLRWWLLSEEFGEEYGDDEEGKREPLA